MNKNKVILIAFLFMLPVLFFTACTTEKDVKKSVLDKTTIDRIKLLEKENNITINYCDVPMNDEIDDEYVLSSDAEEIEAAVEAAEAIFSRLPENWAITISNPEVIIDESEKIEKIHIVFCESIEADEDKNGSEYLIKGNFYYTDDNEMYFLVDIHNYEPEVAISETLIYRMVRKKTIDDEFEIEALGDDGYREQRIQNSIIRRYISYNPEEFDYYGQVSEIKELDKQVVYGYADNLDNVYFVNKESLYSEYIDLTQLVSPLLYTDKSDGLPEVYKSIHVKNKALSAVESINDIFSFRGVEYLMSWFE